MASVVTSPRRDKATTYARPERRRRQTQA
jgi:hypothetical protein